MLSTINPTSQSIALPAPRVSITIRPGVLSDLPFLDALQKLHTKQVGWMPTRQFEEKIKMGHVLVAEEVLRGEGQGASECPASGVSVLAPGPSPLAPVPVGYCIGHDQYFKRDDVGIIYQLNVLPKKQRGLIGATLVKAMFDRAAYGCRLFCCWCAQDIEANYFWESLGFIPLAFRAGSRDKQRVHIFWQRRIRAGDTGQGGTPYWFPSQTSSGSIREDRLVLPIPPGVHWRDAKPMVLPGAENPKLETRNPKQLENTNSKIQEKKMPVMKPSAIILGGLRFAVPKMNVPETKPKREPQPKVKNDPRLVAAARELRDRYLEHVNREGLAMDAQGKYDVSSTLLLRPKEDQERLIEKPKAQLPYTQAA